MRTLKFISAFLFVFFIGMSVNNISVSGSGLLVQPSSAEASQAITGQPVAKKNTTTTAPSKNRVDHAKTQAWGKAYTNRIKLKSITYTEETAGTPLENTFKTIAQWARKFVMVPFATFVGFCFFLSAGTTLKRTADEGRKPEFKEVYFKMIIGTLLIGLTNVVAMILPVNNGCTIDTFIEGICGMTTMTSSGELSQMINQANTGFMMMFKQFFDIAEAISGFIIALGVWALSLAIISLMDIAKDNGKSTIGGLCVKFACSAVIIDHRHMLDMGYNFAKSMGFF